MTPDEQKAKTEAFIKEFGELVAKHKMDFMAYPLWQPSPTGEWRMTIQTQAVSTKDQPIKSPFVTEK